MARDAAYRRAEEKIKEALRSEATTLFLSSRKLTELPESLGQLTQLQALHLAGNQLTALPEWLGQLTQLQIFDLYGNQLTTLPESLGQLKKLQELNLFDNQLTALPEWLDQLNQLRRLDLRNNPDLRLPPEIAAQVGDPSAILNFYFSRLRETEKPLNEAKILLVGDGEVGKTSLIRRLMDDEFDADESKTRGVRIRQWRLQEGIGKSARISGTSVGRTFIIPRINSSSPSGVCTSCSSVPATPKRTRGSTIG